jgi:replication factor A1
MAPAPNGLQGCFPISELSAYTRGWKIRARVTSKAPLRTFKAKGNGADGKVFHVELLDCEGGEIRASFFNQAVDAYYDKLEIGKCFTLSHGSLRVANRQYNTTNHRYEIIFDKEAQVEEVMDDSTIETVKFNISDLRTVQLRALPCTVDLCGVIVSFQPHLAFTSREGKELVKREICLADDTATTMSVTLWGDRAQQPDKAFEGNPVIAIKGVIVKEWGTGRSGSLLEAGALNLQPTMPEADRIRQWWANGGSQQSLTPLSQDGAIKSGQAIVGKPATLADVRKAADEVTNQEVFTVVCRLAMVQTKKQGEDQPLHYMACQEPRENSRLLCNRRVDASGFCAGCNRAGKVAPRLNIRCKFSDAEESAWLTTFHEAAQQVLSMEAAEVKELESTSSREKLETAIRQAYFHRPVQVTVRAKLDSYNGEVRPNISCIDARPVPVAEHGRFLLKEIQEMMAA